MLEAITGTVTKFVSILTVSTSCCSGLDDDSGEGCGAGSCRVVLLVGRRCCDREGVCGSAATTPAIQIEQIRQMRSAAFKISPVQLKCRLVEKTQERIATM